MTKTWKDSNGAGADSLLQCFREAAGDDLRLIAALHDCEIDAVAIAQLKSIDFPLGLGLKFRKPEAREAGRLMAEAVTALPVQASPSLIDELAVDYAAIYLNYRYRAAPTESVWLDKDHLERQQPMFQIRAVYRRRGLKVTDWHKRPEDHLVTQLRFLAHLLGACRDEGALREAANFLDQHLLRWIAMFGATVAQRCTSSFYGALALLTAAYLDELRDVLAAMLDEPRPAVEAAKPGTHESDEPTPQQQPPEPITGPGW